MQSCGNYRGADQSPTNLSTRPVRNDGERGRTSCNHVRKRWAKLAIKSVQGDVGRRNLLMEELQWTHSRSVHTNKEGPTGQCGGADTLLSLRNQHLECRSAESMGKKQEESGLFAAQRL